MQRLLLDITEKYKHPSTSNCYVNKLEKKAMVQEINTLAKALIKNEKKYVKLQDACRRELKDYKRALKEKDQQL